MFREGNSCPRPSPPLLVALVPVPFFALPFDSNGGIMANSYADCDGNSHLRRTLRAALHFSSVGSAVAGPVHFQRNYGFPSS